MKVKIFTHDDIDAAGCAILGKLAFRNNVDIEYHHHESLAQRWDSFTSVVDNKTEYDDYDMVFVVDISPTEEWSAIIDTLDLRNKIKVFDHHKTTLLLNKYDWVLVTVEHYPGRKACGTSLFYNYLMTKDLVPTMEDNFINLIRELDTWEWEAKNNYKAMELGHLFTCLDMERFVNKYVEHFSEIETSFIYAEGDYFNDFDRQLLDLFKYKIQKYINDKSKFIIEKVIDGYNVGVVIAESYPSELGNYIAKNNPQYDFVIVINPNTGISYRCVREDIDLSQFAQKLGGGGHQKASGSRIPDGARDSLVNYIFSNNL